MARRSLSHARILVTGASSGIGRQLALALAREQARLVLVARRETLLEELAGDCRQLGGEAAVVAGDVCLPGVRAAATDAATTRFGGLDVLINNAGVSAHGKFVDSNEEALRRIMEVNFFAGVELTRLAIPLLVAARDRPAAMRPAIVNVGSILGHRGAPLNNEYCASKFALRGWSESLRTELAAAGVDVLMASPGTTDTDFFDSLIAKTGELPWRRAKGADPEEVARQIVRALKRGRREIFPDWRGLLMVVGNRLLPGVVDWRLCRYVDRDGALGAAPAQRPPSNHSRATPPE